ncbi:MAG TPA: ABC transporter ATP-binding protein [Candidatus Sulfotelmatobacter sp.]|nr:ABC transporter ATP-binding protein [Candidatus Sulfotelmatobacter sp.]
MSTTNVPARFPIQVDPMIPARPGTRGGKIGPASVGHVVRPASPGVPKVGLSDISLSYRAQSGERLLALDHINLQVKAGEFVCIVGPSGCGKSTLLHLIAGLHSQTSGQVLIDGNPVAGPGTDRIMIFQEHALFPWLTVGQNVEFGMKMKGVPRAEREERVRYYLRLVHLAKFEKSYIHQLSGGMRQRVAIARALATEPDVLLMDEPFAALDAQTRDLLHDELERIWSETGRTIIFVTHNVREAIRLGDRVVLMTFRPGRVKSEFSVELPRPRHLEDPDVAHAAREVLDELREEINHSLEAEYNVGVKPRIEPQVSGGVRV